MKSVFFLAALLISGGVAHAQLSPSEGASPASDLLSEETAAPPSHPGGPTHPAPHPIEPGHPGGPHHGGFHPRPVSWHFDRTWHPRWWRAGFAFPVFEFDVSVPAGYEQCTAFNQGVMSFTEYGPDLETASYYALYACGGDNYEISGCYIPDGYCQVR